LERQKVPKSRSDKVQFRFDLLLAAARLWALLTAILSIRNGVLRREPGITPGGNQPSSTGNEAHATVLLCYSLPPRVTIKKP
jgi:hypothetical protein